MTGIAAGRATPIDQLLRTEPTVWLSSTRPDGRPHVVPVWFTWDGRVIDLFSKPASQKVRNLREHPATMLAVGQPDEDFDVELIEGTATVLPQPTAEVVPSALFAKYAELMARAGLDRDTYVRVYSQPIRIQPTRFLGYGGKGWTDAPPDDGGFDVAGHLGPAAPVPTPAQRHAAEEIRRVARSFGADTAALAALEG